jgi:CubicO group peptidase (beta-lactamase class C family)
MGTKPIGPRRRRKGMRPFTAQQMLRSAMNVLAASAVAACLVSVGAPQLAGAQSTDPAARYVDQILSRYQGPNPTPGCAVGVVRDGALAFASGYGYADLEHAVRITPRTSFYLASLSKQFTAMSIVLLEQDGKLTLDDDIRQWIELSDSITQRISIRHLLSHTSGLNDYFTLLALQGWSSDEPWTETQLLDLVRRQPRLSARPGDQFLYSNTGYALLGVIVRRVSGMPLREFAARRIFTPLGMTSTRFRDDHRSLIPDRALAYDPAGSGFRLNVPEMDVVGDGGAYSTVEDLARWDANFETGIVGGKAGVAKLQQPGALNSGTVTGYAMGLTLSVLGASPTVSMSGSYGGYASSYVRVPDIRVSVVALCNTSAAPPRLADQIATLYVPMTVGTGSLPGISVPTLIPPPGSLTRSVIQAGSSVVIDPGDRHAGPAPRDPAELPALEARYLSDELNMTVTLRARDNLLVMERPRGDRVSFSRVAPDLFASADGIILKVTRDQTGLAKGFTLTLGRVADVRFVRLLF